MKDALQQKWRAQVRGIEYLMGDRLEQLPRWFAPHSEKSRDLPCLVASGVQLALSALNHGEISARPTIPNASRNRRAMQGTAAAAG